MSLPTGYHHNSLPRPCSLYSPGADRIENTASNNSSIACVSFAAILVYLAFTRQRKCNHVTVCYLGSFGITEFENLCLRYLRESVEFVYHSLVALNVFFIACSSIASFCRELKQFISATNLDSWSKFGSRKAEPVCIASFVFYVMSS
jgi:hypothetical protein